MLTLVVPIAVICGAALFFAHFGVLSFFTYESDEEVSGDNDD